MSIVSKPIIVPVLVKYAHIVDLRIVEMLEMRMKWCLQ